jgi:transposase
MENDFDHFIGIDASKKKIDVFILETSSHFLVANNAEAILEKFSGLKLDRERTLIVIENTGKYESVCMRTLFDLGFKLHRANGSITRHFMELIGQNASTDKMDAKGLANYGRSYDKVIALCKKNEKMRIFCERDFIDEDLRQISNQIEKLKKTRAAYKNKYKSPSTGNVIHDSNQRVIDYLTEEIEREEKMLEEVIKKDKNVSSKVDLVSQYKGIGRTTARELIIHLPELGELSGKKIAALSGLAPYVKQSGNKTFYSTTRGRGRPKVKSTLFMATLSGIRFNPELAKYYNERVEVCAKGEKKGRPKKIIILKCMHKMLSQLNAIVKRGKMLF